MEYYTLTDPVAGNDTIVDQTNKIAINVERLLSSVDPIGAFYVNYDFSVDTLKSSPITFNDTYENNFFGTNFESILYDDSKILDIKTKVDFKIPVGFTRAKLYGYCALSNSGTRKTSMSFLKNGSLSFIGNTARGPGDGIGATSSNLGFSVIRTAWLSVKPLDSFQLLLTNTGSVADAHGAFIDTPVFALELRQ